jgi:hypothetical protein
MSETLRRVQAPVLSGDFPVSDHGFAELEHIVCRCYRSMRAGKVSGGIGTAKLRR